MSSVALFLVIEFRRTEETLCGAARGHVKETHLSHSRW